MNDTTITVIGNLGQDPSRRVLASGVVVTDLRVAHTPRRLDKASGEWRDLETIWFSVTCWRDLADNVAASMKKGDRVVVQGRFTTKGYTTKEGESRLSLDIDASAVGFELSRATVTAHRRERAADVDAAVAVDDPWSTQPVDPSTGEVLPGQAAA